MYLVFGGTFDPIHFGHLACCQAVSEAFDHHIVHLMPCFQPVHKSSPSASAAHRLNMLRLAISDHPFLAIDTTEIDAQKPLYTIETLRILKKQQDRITLIIGSDSWDQWDRWHKPEHILALANLIVIHRPGYPSNRLKPLLVANLLYGPSFGQVAGLEIDFDPKIAHANSQKIRQHDSKESHAWLHDDVKQYLSTHELYKEH